MTHVNNQCDKAQTLGDANMDTREEYIMKHALDAPISTWKIPPQLYKDGYDCLCFLNKNSGNLQQVLGLTDTVLDSLQIDDKDLSFHMYENGTIQSVEILTGEHYINKGAYAAHAIVAGGGIVHIAGHIGELIVTNYGQVILYDTAYVDKLVVMKDGYAQIHAGASIYNMNVEEGGRCLLSDKAKVHTKFYCSGTIGKLTEKPCIKHYQILIHVARKDIIPLCQKLTDQVMHETGSVEFDAVSCWGVSGCRVDAMYMDPDPDKDDWIVSFYATEIEDLDEYVERRIKESSTLKDFSISNVEVLIDGQHAFRYFHDMKEKELKQVELKHVVRPPWDDGHWESDLDMPPIGAPVHDEEAWDDYHKKRAEEAERKKAAWMKAQQEKEEPRIFPAPNEGESLKAYLKRCCGDKEFPTNVIIDLVLEWQEQKKLWDKMADAKAKRESHSGDVVYPEELTSSYVPMHKDEDGTPYINMKAKETIGVTIQNAADVKRVQLTFGPEDYMDSYPDIHIDRKENKPSNALKNQVDLTSYLRDVKDKERRRADEEDDTDCTGSPYNT